MIWKLKSFSELSLNEFHDILKLRIDVFVVEQNCPYPELDGKDKLALHFYGIDEASEKIIAYARLFKPGDYYEKAAIGRVVVHPEFRKKKIGHELIDKAILQIKEQFSTNKIKIGAQTYLIDFYKQHGFQPVGDTYLEDGIPHVKMLRN